MLFSAVQVLAGEGTVVRSGDVVLWWEPGPTAAGDLAAQLVALVGALAAEGPDAAGSAGPRVADLLRAGDAQALSGLVVALPSASGLRVVVLGGAQVLAGGVDIPRGWVDTEIAWPSSMSIGRADGRLTPPVAGSPYDLVEGGTPGSGAAIVLAARPDLAPPGPASVSPVEAPIATSSVAFTPPADAEAPAMPEPATADTVLFAPLPAPEPLPEPSPLPQPEPLAEPAPMITTAAHDDAPTVAWTATGETEPPPPVAAPLQAVIADPDPIPGPVEALADETASMPLPEPPGPVAATPWDAPAPAMPGPPRFSPDPAPLPVAPAAPPTPAAIYGAIVLDDGSAWSLDGDYAIGSNPSGAPDVMAGTLRGLPVADPSGQTHPAHAEVRHAEGGMLYLVARAPTYLLHEGTTAWQEAPLHQGVALQPGVRVAIGQRTFTLAAPTWTGA
jgi:hypothetical protein